MLAVKPNDLSLTPGIHVMEGETLLLQAALCTDMH